MTCYEDRGGRRVKVTCPDVRRAPAELEAAHGPLAGDVLAALIAAIGIPPCGGCEQRRQWLNRAHAWITNRVLGAGCTKSTEG